MTTTIVPLFTYLNKKIKGAWNMTRFGKDRNLFFSNKDVLSGSVIANDARKRKLLFFRRSDYRQSCMIINLEELENCSVVRQYNEINAGELKHKKLHRFLKSIYLKLHFKNQTQTVAIPFYESGFSSDQDIERLEIKANKWKLILSKTLPIRIG
jgi:hypothetical protein